jgi:hypothetical protein
MVFKGSLGLQPGVDPAYTVFEVAITPTGGLNVAGAQEAATRSRYEVPIDLGCTTNHI